MRYLIKNNIRNSFQYLLSLTKILNTLKFLFIFKIFILINNTDFKLFNKFILFLCKIIKKYNIPIYLSLIITLNNLSPSINSEI